MRADDAKIWVELIAKLRDAHAAHHWDDSRVKLGHADGKDWAAFLALRNAKQLVWLLADWAINHQTGLAKEWLSFVPSVPAGVRASAEFVAQRVAVDDHRHELAGRIGGTSQIDPMFARAAAVNLLRANPGAFPDSIAAMLADALEALEYGDVHPILAPQRRGKKVGFNEAKLQLRALEFVRYRSARHRMRIQAATEDVADVLGVSPATLRAWQNRLPSSLGTTRVNSALETALLMGEREAELARAEMRGEPLPFERMYDPLYDDLALRKLAEEFRSVQRQGQ